MCDNYSQWKLREQQHECWLKKRPLCDYCEEHIQEEHFYLINGECICPDCMENNFKKWTEDFVD